MPWRNPHAMLGSKGRFRLDQLRVAPVRLRGLGRDDYVVTESGSRMVKIGKLHTWKDWRREGQTNSVTSKVQEKVMQTYPENIYKLWPMLLSSHSIFYCGFDQQWIHLRTWYSHMVAFLTKDDATLLQFESRKQDSRKYCHDIQWLPTINHCYPTIKHHCKACSSAASSPVSLIGCQPTFTSCISGASAPIHHCTPPDSTFTGIHQVQWVDEDGLVSELLLLVDEVPWRFGDFPWFRSTFFQRWVHARIRIPPPRSLDEWQQICWKSHGNQYVRRICLDFLNIFQHFPSIS